MVFTLRMMSNWPSGRVFENPFGQQRLLQVLRIRSLDHLLLDFGRMIVSPAVADSSMQFGMGKIRECTMCALHLCLSLQ